MDGSRQRLHYVLNVLVLSTVWTSSANCAVVTLFTDETADDIASRSALARDNRYGLWVTPRSIPFKLDTTYSADEQRIITQAMSAISADMNGCIGFTNWNPASGQDYLFFGKSPNGGTTLPQTCYTFPGRLLTQQGRGQKIIMFAGPDGCLGSVKDAMVVIASVLGLRNELRRPDRASFIQVFPQNVKPELQVLNLTQVYTGNQVDYMNTGFDFNSITIPMPEKYTRPGSLLYAPTSPSRQIGHLPRLSKGDCEAFSMLYTTCNVRSCGDPYQLPSAPSLLPVVTAAPATSVSSSAAVLTTTATGGSVLMVPSTVSVPSLAGMPLPVGP